LTTEALSSHRSVSATPLLNDTLGGCLGKAAQRWLDKEAVVVRDQAVRMTFGALMVAADRLAAGLIALGLKPVDQVA
jgi:fatty-acyl-CoA synthase